MTDTDQTLVIKSQRGDRAAFEELVRRLARLLFARIYADVGDAHRAEDLVQETFLVAWRSIGQVTDPSGVRLWLLSIARSVVVDALRRDTRKKRSGTRSDPAVLDDLPDASGGPLQAASTKESREKVLSVLRSLPEEYRMPLMLRYITGADYQTIGQQLGLSNGSLRGMLSRGMNLLRDRLGKTIGSDLFAEK